MNTNNTFPDVRSKNKDKSLQGAVIFKEITEKPDLLTALSFRHSEYMESRMKNWLSGKNNGKVNIDSWDGYSNHFGCWIGTQMIGYIRVIQSEPTKWYSDILTIANDENITISAIPSFIFPMMDFYPMGIEAYDEIKKENSNSNITSPSKFIIKQGHRDIQLATFLAESILVTGIGKYSHAMIDCAESHVGFYYRLGFERAKPTVPSKIKYTELPWALLRLTLGKEQFESSERKHFLEKQEFFMYNGFLHMEFEKKTDI